MNPLETAAALISIINVALVMRRSLWNFPWGLVGVVLYGIVFFRARLYSDTLLQLFFFITQTYGWWVWWHSPKTDETHIEVLVLSASNRLLWVGFTAVGAVVLGFLMRHFTDAAVPWLDAIIAGFSVSAQLLQSRRYLECWGVWVGVNMLATVVYWTRDLRVTAGLFFIMLVMAVFGHRAWRLAMSGQSG